MPTGCDETNEKPTAVFGLTKAQLWPIVESVAGEPVVSFEASIEHQVRGHFGYSAEKVIPTFTYTTPTDRARSVTVFAKWFHRPGPAEAHQYRYLESHQAPIPQMYGALTGPDQREMIFLEYLDPINDLHPFRWFFSDPDRFRQFLAAAAHFNAIQPSEEYADQLPSKDFEEGLRETPVVLDRVWEHACKGDLGQALERLCTDSQDKVPALQKLAGTLVEPIARMETGLAHNDLYPDSTGWRRGDRELLILDLESVGFAPRFFDVARWVGAPDEVQTRCRLRRELAEHYLEQYARWGGRAASVDQFLEETHLLWMAGTLTMLWFGLHRALDGRVDWTEDREEGRRVFREGLHSDLRMLLRQALSPNPLG